MELIKKIKQTEAQAQEIIEQAGTRAVEQAEKGRRSRLETLESAERERKQATEAAVAAAHSDGLSEVEKLRAQAEKDRRKLRDKVADKMAPAVTKVMDYLKG
jgi:vacuolar-type H+-ATPase subunit H